MELLLKASLPYDLVNYSKYGVIFSIVCLLGGGWLFAENFPTYLWVLSTVACLSSALFTFLFFMAETDHISTCRKPAGNVALFTLGLLLSVPLIKFLDGQGFGICIFAILFLYALFFLLPMTLFCCRRTKLLKSIREHDCKTQRVKSDGLLILNCKKEGIQFSKQSISYYLFIAISIIGGSFLFESYEVFNYGLVAGLFLAVGHFVIWYYGYNFLFSLNLIVFMFSQVGLICIDSESYLLLGLQIFVLIICFFLPISLMLLLFKKKINKQIAIRHELYSEES